MIRKPFQGVSNIIRFNWHFYLGAGFLFLIGLIILPYLPPSIQFIGKAVICLALIQIVISLLVSWYVYDYSDLYQMKWLKIAPSNRLLNINAGFDETSGLIQEQFPDNQLSVCDFFDPNLHTEVSILRARKAYPPYPGTDSVDTSSLPFSDDSFETVLATLSAHEIRNAGERIAFFKELQRVTTANGNIYVTEHLRDTANFLAYTIGFFHFHSRSTWETTFEKAGLTLVNEVKTTPFITTFILQSHGNTP